MRRCLALALSVCLLLAGCAPEPSPPAPRQALAALAPAEPWALWYEDAPFAPQDPLMTDGAALYISLADAVAFLRLTAEEVEGRHLLHTPRGTLVLDPAAGTATLEGAALEGYAFGATQDTLYLPLAQTAQAAWAWHSPDERTQRLYAGSRTGNQYGDIEVSAKAKGTQFLYYDGEMWRADTARGVNLGLSLPGHSVGERIIPYETYLVWFEQIAQMNANSLRVYSRQPAAFYRALLDYNQRADTPLWLYQGVWVEQKASLSEDAAAQALEDARLLVDIVHGQGGEEYVYDVSPWLGGWVIGSEWSAAYIDATNEETLAPHEGQYLYTLPGTPAFETRLCAIGDGLAARQTEAYGRQAPIAFINWPTTDTLAHPSEANPAEDAATLDTERILAGDGFLPGLFALYHVYPTYPEFIAQEAREDGYAEYLARLWQSHTVPAMVGEYGASASRGHSHRGQDGQYTQGGLSEAEQGEQNAAMTHAVFGAGFAGAMLFAWQDEWFKDVWNTRAQTLPEYNQYWYNAQNSEQSYGVLGVFPGEDGPPAYLDGEGGEWDESRLVAATDDGRLYATWDEGYLYLMLRFADGYDTGQGVLLPISIHAEAGLARHGAARFEETSQFLVEVDSPQSARLLVSADHDAFALQYGRPGEVADESFHPVRQYLRGGYTRPDTGEEVPSDVVETGRLRPGVTNPEAAAFDSRADFCWEGSCLEIRLPWMLIGFMDPSRLLVTAPLREGEDIASIELERLSLGFGAPGAKAIPMEDCPLEPWGEEVRFHLRLKQSYYTMQQVFASYKCPAP